MPGDEKTEPATPRRRQEARQKGQVAKSQEISNAFAIIVAFLFLRFYAASMFRDMVVLLKHSFRLMPTYQPINAAPTIQNLANIMGYSIFVFAKITIPFLIVAFLIGMATNLPQVGFHLSAEPMKPSLERINPIKGFQRLFSMRAVVELLKSVLKVGIIFYVAYAVIRGMLPEFIPLAAQPPFKTISFIGLTIFRLAMYVGIVYLLLAIFDYFYQKMEFEKSIRMTKQEVKEEMKQREGDPLIKSRLRERAREIAFRRMMARVPEAEVVITNPVHLAVALKYDIDEMDAPLVIAKGAGVVAQRIKDIAKENSVPVVEDKPLAQALFKMCEVGDYVPPTMFKAVAEVLAYVYKLKNKVVNLT